MIRCPSGYVTTRRVVAVWPFKSSIALGQSIAIEMPLYLTTSMRLPSGAQNKRTHDNRFCESSRRPAKKLHLVLGLIY